MTIPQRKFVSSQMANILTQADGDELRRRLELYQVFSKLYEHHQGLLHEILDLENSAGKSIAHNGLFQYIQGVVTAADAYIVTNLVGATTTAITHPQKVWTIGRDSRRVTLAVRDQRLSRSHAAIRYVPQDGFYLIDLASTNGCFINGDRIQQQRLQDGDRLRLGSCAVAFFVCETYRTAPLPTPERWAELQANLQIGPAVAPSALRDEMPAIAGLSGDEDQADSAAEADPLAEVDPAAEADPFDEADTFYFLRSNSPE